METGKTICDFKRLNAVCDSLNWNEENQNWRTHDGKWYSFDFYELSVLGKTLELLNDFSTIGMDYQWIISTRVLSKLKNILTHPDMSVECNKITRLTWQLVFNIMTGNLINQQNMWNELDELFFSCLQWDEYPHKDICRLIMFNIYGLGGVAQNEGTRILKILLRNLHEEMEVDPSQKQGLNIFVEFFIIDEKQISTMYFQLDSYEKLELLNFIKEYMHNSQLYGRPISMDLLQRICDEFNSKTERIYNNFVDMQELLIMFAVIASASNEPYYELNRLELNLTLSIGALLRYVLLNEEATEEAFLGINKVDSLKILLLNSISNLVKCSYLNSNMAREQGLIKTIVDLLIKYENNPVIYKHGVFSLREICHNNTTNQDYLDEFVRQDCGNEEMLRNLLVDVKWKKK